MRSPGLSYGPTRQGVYSIPEGRVVKPREGRGEPPRAIRRPEKAEPNRGGCGFGSRDMTDARKFLFLMNNCIRDILQTDLKKNRSRGERGDVPDVGDTAAANGENSLPPGEAGTANAKIRGSNMKFVVCGFKAPWYSHYAEILVFDEQLH